MICHALTFKTPRCFEPSLNHTLQSSIIFLIHIDLNNICNLISFLHSITFHSFVAVNLLLPLDINDLLSLYFVGLFFILSLKKTLWYTKAVSYHQNLQSKSILILSPFLLFLLLICLCFCTLFENFLQSWLSFTVLIYSIRFLYTEATHSSCFCQFLGFCIYFL